MPIDDLIWFFFIVWPIFLHLQLIHLNKLSEEKYLSIDLGLTYYRSNNNKKKFDNKIHGLDYIVLAIFFPWKINFHYTIQSNPIEIKSNQQQWKCWWCISFCKKKKYFNRHWMYMDTPNMISMIRWWKMIQL